MTKRIVSGIFILTALGALGVILAGALTSGEQLIVRFLTAVIVAALGLYVISDLRLQADDQASSRRSRTGPGSFATVGDLPANSTAAFMATVTASRQPEELGIVPDGDQMGNTEVEIDVVTAHDTPSEDADELDIVESAVTVEKLDEFDSVDSNSIESESAGSGHSDDNDTNGDDVNSNGALGEHVEAFDITRDNSFSFHGKIETSKDVSSNGSSTNGSSVNLIGAADHDQAPTDEQPAISVPDHHDDIISKNSVIDLGQTDHSDSIGSPWTNGESNEFDSNGGSGDAASPDGKSSDLEHAWPVSSAYDPRTNSEIDDNQPIVISEDAVAAEPAAEQDETLTSAEAEIIAASQQIDAADYVDAPLAPIIDLREVHSFQTAGNVDNAIRAGEVEVISTLIEQGMLSTEGAISDRDVRTMVYVAFTSNELRKLLLAGGTPDGQNQGLDLGPVELFDETLHTPAPKTVYQGQGQLNGSGNPQLAPATEDEPQRQLG